MRISRVGGEQHYGESMDFHNRGLSSEDFELADHFSNRKLTFSHPDRHLGETVTESFIDVFAQFNEKFFSSFSLLKVKTSATGIALAPEPRLVTYRPKDLPRDLKNPLHHIPTPRDLTLRYWWLPNLDKAEEAGLVGLAQSGDRWAVAELFKHFHKFILRAAGKHMRGRQQGNWNKVTDGLFADLVAAGCVGFCGALRGFDLSLGHRFSALARYRIAGAISDEAVNFRKRGIVSETIAHRAIFRRSKSRVFKSFEEFATAREEIEAWGRRESYADDPGEGPSNDLRRGDAEYKADQEFRPKQGPSRKRDHIDDAAIDADKRAARRLKEIGRPKYALELSAREAARAEAAKKRDRIEWAAACASRGIVPTDSRKIAAEERIVNLQDYRPRIQVWRAA